MTFTIEDWGTDDIINSTDIIERHSELEDELETLLDDVDNAAEMFTSQREHCAVYGTSQNPDEIAELYRLRNVWDAAMQLMERWRAENQAELNALQAICKLGEGYGDWSHGDVLISEDYFTKYIEELIGDCYEMPKGFDSNAWPWRHMKIDYEAAAEEAKSDYVEIECNGHTYSFRA